MINYSDIMRHFMLKTVSFTMTLDRNSDIAGNALTAWLWEKLPSVIVSFSVTEKLIYLSRLILYIILYIKDDKSVSVCVYAHDTMSLCHCSD